MSPLDGPAKPFPKPPTRSSKSKKTNVASPGRKRDIRAKKANECRTCPNPGSLPIHAHHVVREGGQWRGQWTENNIVGLCAACHQGLHSGDDRVKKILRVRLTGAEVRYADERAYPGYVDAIYWRVRPCGVNPGTLEGE